MEVTSIVLSFDTLLHSENTFCLSRKTSSSNVLFFNAKFSPFDISALYCSLRTSSCVIFCFHFFEIEGFSSTTTVRTAYDVEMRHLRLILLAKTASGPKNNNLLPELKREQNKHLKKKYMATTK